MDYVRVLDEIFSQFTGPKFSIRFWNGKENEYGNGSESAFTLVINSKAVVRRFITQGAIGFGESYMDGSLRVEGDLEAYLRLRHQFKHVRRTWRLVCATLIALVTSPFDRKKQIAQHYDLGNEFFGMILDDETMSYSAAKYEGTETLGEAQKSKLSYISDLLTLPEHAEILDLGSGWGGFATFAAKNKKWNILGYTLSNAQLTYCRELMRKEKLEDSVTFEYHDMLGHLSQKQFDAVVAIESIEHVGKGRITRFLTEVAQVLKPGGSLYIQTTGRYIARDVDPWTLKYVFPGGYLPSKDQLLSAAATAGLTVEVFQDDTEDYIRTMTAWIEQLEARRSEIEHMFNPAFYRLWELWMHGAKVAFEENSMSLFRILLKRPM
ncbi:MAG: cyclopropane-fatty-acyl-phospholipid synthase [Parcubacteria bacterium C7867-008]|nr:MAG: cyclopropane-fatty-acyl-phospholipid synthase [Parcubacteria bacterium C7867-008]